MKIKISITDDHPLVVSGLQTILKSFEQIDVIATYFSGEDLVSGLEQAQPDVLLTDLHMPGTMHGLTLIHFIRRRYPELPILVLSGQESIFNVKDIMEMGCKGYLLKNTTDPNMLLNAIEEVYYGGLFLEPHLKDKLLHGILKTNKQHKQTSSIITQRQIEIIQLLAQGNTSQQIADQLYVSVRTIESHRQRLMRKLEVNNVTSLIHKATELCLIDPILLLNSKQE